MSQADLTQSAAVAIPRKRTFDPLLLLWIVLAVVLIFLVVNPLFRLVQLSLQDADTGAFTLMNYVAAYSRPRYLEATWNSLALGFWVTVLCLLFAVPVAWAVSRTDMPGKGAIRLLVLGDFRHPALSGIDRLDPAGGPEFRLVEPDLDGADRRARRPVQHLFVCRPGFQHRDLLLSVSVHLHHRGAGRGVVRDGGRGQHPWRRHAAYHVADHSAAGAAGDPGRRHHHVPGSDRIVRLAGADRDTGTLQRGDDTVAAVLQPADPRRSGGGVCGAAAADHGGLVRHAALAGTSARLRRADRQGW